MENKDISTQVNFDSENLKINLKSENSPLKTIRVIQRVREKPDFQERRMKIDKLLLSSFQSSKKNSLKFYTPRTKFLSRLRIQIESTKIFNAKKSFLDISCQGKRLYTVNTEDSFSNRNEAEIEYFRENSENRSRKKVNTIELLHKYKQENSGAKSLRESKIISKVSLKKIGDLKIKYPNLRKLIQISKFKYNHQ